MVRRGTGDLARITFGVLVIGLLLAACLWILRPFLGPTIWAVMVVVATWPLMLRVQRHLWGRRALAVAVMTLALLLLFVVPLTLAIVTIVGNADRLIEWAKLASDYHLPEVPPRWLLDLPVVGSLLERAWVQASELGVRDLLPRLSPYAGNLTRWFVSEVGSVGVLLLQFLLTVLISGVLYSHGEAAADHVRRFASPPGRRAWCWRCGAGWRSHSRRGPGRRRHGPRAGADGRPGPGAGRRAVCRAVDGAAVHVCIAQIGPIPVLLGAAGWALYDGSMGWAIALAVWGTLVGTLDNFLRPVLIKMGADLPLLLIFAGVIGGLFAFGLVGIFVGPVVLAVAYTLLEAWMDDRPAPPPAPPEYRD
jgi:predicted PurR-regulated permease PerM